MIVGLSGKKQSGKDSCGSFLWEHYGFYKWAYADALKHVVRDLWNVPHKWLWGTDKEKEKIVVIADEEMTVRSLLQEFGSDCCRCFDPDIWVNRLFREIDHIEKGCWGGYHVITDVRFPNEIDAIQKRGGIVIRLTRNPCKIDTHYSEALTNGCELYDYILDNRVLTEEETNEELIRIITRHERVQQGKRETS